MATVAGLLFSASAFAQSELPNTVIKNVSTGKKVAFQETVEPGKVTLVSFWATWCVPCLQNIEAIHNMDLPANLEIIYISMDRTKDREKWSKKSHDFNLSNSYLFAETQNNKAIITKIGLNQLPRYILVDKDFNILNPNLATPQETDFLKELEMYINK